MSKRKLLLADDSITIQKVVNLTFADEGIEVISVGDGDSAMRKFDEFMPDLVMADVNMPGLNGYEVCRIIKVTEETKHIPVILLVGSFEPFDETEAKEAGADDFLTKPFQSIRQLVNKVTDLLNRSARSSEETQAAAPVIDSFAETMEFNKEELPAEPAEPEASSDFENRQDFSSGFETRPTEISSEFGDAGMDDDMIEASPATDYVSGSDSVYQGETTIDYAKTQPLNADDLKGFEIIPGGNSGQEPVETYENLEPLTEPTQAADERSEPASFDEEARKLDQTEDYESPQNDDEFGVPRKDEEYPAQQADEEEPENLSETEPQVDYYLPEEPEFEKEISDAETLAPDVSYEADEPREADFSQATVAELNENEAETEAETGAETEESSEPAAAPYSFYKDETDDFDKTEAADEYAPEKIEEETPETSAASFADELQTPETDARFGSWEHPISYSEAETETESENAEEAETEQAQPEAEKVEETEVSEAETEEPQETGETREAGETQESAAAEDAQTETGTINETPVYAAENAPALDFDDGDLLELPPLVEETGIRPQSKAEALVPEIVASPAVAEPESKITVTKTVAESEIALSFPPELIEAIAQAVAEKISAKTLSDVVPQITELVMKKLAEERKE